MEWKRLRNYILNLHRFDVQPKLKDRNLPSGILPIPRLFLELAMSELSPVEFKVFFRLYSMLDFDLRTHWVVGVSTQELADLCKCKKATIYNALDELKRKGYIYVLSGHKAKKKVKAIRKKIYGEAIDFGGNDYNAYSLLPFFTRVFIELDTKRFEEANSDEPLPPDEEIVAELPQESTNALKSLSDKEEEGASVMIDLTTNASKSLGDKDEEDVSVYQDQPQSIKTNLGLSRLTLVKIDDDQRNTNQRNTNQRHTHQRREEPAEKNRFPSGTPADDQPPQKPEPQGSEKPSRPADQLPNAVREALLDHIRRQRTARSPIAVLKAMSEAEVKELAREVLSELIRYDYELQEEIDRLPDGLDVIELLEYALLSEEGRLEWLEKKGIALAKPEELSREAIEETIRELIERFDGDLEKVQEVLKGLYGRDEERFEEVRKVWKELKSAGKLYIDKEKNYVEWR